MQVIVTSLGTNPINCLGNIKVFEQKVVIKQAIKLNRFSQLQAQLKESRVSILNNEGVGYGEVTEIIFLPKKLEVRVKTVSKTLDLSRHTFVCTNGVWSLTDGQ